MAGLLMLGLGLAGASMIGAALILASQPSSAAVGSGPVGSPHEERGAIGDAGVEGDSAPEPEAGSSPRRGIASLASAHWVAEQAERSGVPARALMAYAGAELQLAAEQPGCGVDWATLAGIGHVESGHGTIHGGTIAADGVQNPAILGIALDGASTAAVPDSDAGALDGDAVWDRAVGPMQIIPETWHRYAADGDGDGTLDPQQIDDAALTAARYLCATGADLRTSDGWISAVAAYNDNIDYNHRVADATDFYRQGSTR